MSDNQTKQVVFTINNQDYVRDSADQEVVTVTDRSGHSIQYHVFEGVHYGLAFSVSNLRQLRGFKMRPDDIYFIGYPRSGTYWTYERLAMLINGKAETIKKYKNHLDLLPESHFADIPSPRIIHSHRKMSNSPEELVTKKCKVVYSMRDPKDVIVSLYNFLYGRRLDSEPYWGSFPDFLQLFLNGTVSYNGLFEHWRDAEKYFEDHPDVPAYINIYEDGQKDPLKAVQNLSDFLDLPRDDNLFQAIAEKCEFSKMKVDKEDYSLKAEGKSFIFRKGTSGEWRAWFTEELLDEYYKVYEEKMAGSRFYHRYSRKATT